MKTLIAGTLIGTAILTGPVNAAPAVVDQSRPHDDTRATFILSHAIAGALLAGPIGYGVGALTGAWVGEQVVDGYEHEAQLEEVSASLAVARTRNSELAARLADSRREAAALQGIAVDSLQFQVLFRTGNDRLDAASAERIGKLADYLVREPGLQVRLSGYADPRGAATYNDELSGARAATVAALMISRGVAAERIGTVAYGERRSQAAEGDLDSYAFDRRVDIELVPTGDATLASGIDTEPTPF